MPSDVLKKLSIGLETVVDAIQKVSADNVSTPYNIKKTGKGKYELSVAVAGIEAADISAFINDDILTITSGKPKAKLKPRRGKSDKKDKKDPFKIFDKSFELLAGSLFDSHVWVRFIISKSLEIKSAELRNGILVFKFEDTAKPRGKKELTIVPKFGPIVFEPTEDEKIPVLVNSKDTTVPTTQVILPPVIPAVIEVKTETISGVDPKSSKPQVIITVEDATYEVSDNVKTSVIKTSEDTTDIVVAVPTSIDASLTKAGIDVVADVKAAIEEATKEEAVVVADAPTPVDINQVAPVSVDLKPSNSVDAVTVEVPVLVSSVNEVTVEKEVTAYNSLGEPIEWTPKIVITPVAEVEADANIVPVVTGTDQSDVMVVISPDTQIMLDDLGIDITKDVSSALVKAETEVIPTVEATVVEVAPVVEEVPIEVPVVEEPVIVDVVPEVVSTIVNSEDTTTPTTEVILPPVIPAVIEVTADVADKVDPVSEEPQAVITVSDATYEVSDNVVTDVIKTPDGQSDIVVAIPAEVHEELTNAGIDVVADVKAAIEEATKTEEVVVVDAPTEDHEAVVEAQVPVVVEVVPTATEEKAPESIKVEVPEVVSSVVEVTVEDVALSYNSKGEPVETEPIVVVTPIADVPVEAEIIPVVTKEDQSDVVVAVTPETQAKLDELGIDVAKDISTALIEAETEVVPTTPVVEEVAPVVEEVKAPEPVAEVPVAEPVVEPVVEAPVPQETLVPVEEAKVEEPVVSPVVEEVKSEAPVAEPVVEEVHTVSAVVNSEDKTTPTVEVILPEEIPAIVEVKVEEVPAKVDAVSSEPQVKLKVSDATYEVSDNVVTDVIKTPEGQPDVVVAIAPETKEALEKIGIDPVEAIQTAIEETKEVTVAVSEETKLPVEAETVTVAVTDPETKDHILEVTVPEVVTPVMEATITESTSEAPAIELKDVSHDIPADAELIPVVTKEGQSDIMIAVTPEVKEVLVEAEVDIAKDVSTALVTGDVEVTSTDTGPPIE